MLKFYKKNRIADNYEVNSKWMHVILFVALFSLIAQWNTISEIRSIYLSAGSLAVLFFALIVLFSELRGDKLLIVFTVFLLVYWLFAFPAAINGNDDNTAYLIFAKDFYDSIQKTIQPLSERRIFSVGGLYAFQGPVLHWIGPYGLSLVEPVFGLILFFIVINANISNVHRWGIYLLTGLLGLVPLAGSKVLANTGSVFLLSLFSFALLQLGKEIYQKEKANLMQVFLVILLPLAAATFRPTTAPFNGLISLAILFIIGLKFYDVKKIIKASVFGLCIFYFAVSPYYQIASTYLYPILGRGSHITSEGYSISQSLAIEIHFINILKIAFFDPLFYLNSISLISILIIDNQRKFTSMLITAFVIYVSFYLLIVVGTGGLASVRYIFPVSLALALSQLLILFGEFKIVFLSFLEKHLNNIKLGWVGLIVVVLLGIRFTVGPAVIEKRLKMYEPGKDVILNIELIKDLVSKNNGSTLFISTGYDRFLVEKINSKYFIMDQPGMLTPWGSENMSYENGLLNFMTINNIKNIVMSNPNCSVNEIKKSYVGWGGIADLAEQRNRSSICNIIKKYNTQVIGPFTVAISREIMESKR